MSHTEGYIDTTLAMMHNDHQGQTLNAHTWKHGTD